MYERFEVSKHILSCLAFVILAGCGAGGLAPPLGGEKSGTIQIQSLTLPPSLPLTTNKDAAPHGGSGRKGVSHGDISARGALKSRWFRSVWSALLTKSGSIQKS